MFVGYSWQSDLDLGRSVLPGAEVVLVVGVHQVVALVANAVLVGLIGIGQLAEIPFDPALVSGHSGR